MEKWYRGTMYQETEYNFAISLSEEESIVLVNIMNKIKPVDMDGKGYLPVLSIQFKSYDSFSDVCKSHGEYFWKEFDEENDPSIISIGGKPF